jgi:acyl carrier protein
MNDQLGSKITSLVADMLNIEPSSLSSQLRSQIANWDSLRHMELILRLEEEFQVRFSSKEVAEIKSLEDFVQMIEAKS